MQAVKESIPVMQYSKVNINIDMPIIHITALLGDVFIVFSFWNKKFGDIINTNPNNRNK